MASLAVIAKVLFSICEGSSFQDVEDLPYSLFHYRPIPTTATVSTNIAKKPSCPTWPWHLMLSFRAKRSGVEKSQKGR